MSETIESTIVRIKDLDDEMREDLILEVTDNGDYMNWTDEELGELSVEEALKIVEKDMSESQVPDRLRDQVAARVRKIAEIREFAERLAGR